MPAETNASRAKHKRQARRPGHDARRARGVLLVVHARRPRALVQRPDARRVGGLRGRDVCRVPARRAGALRVAAVALGRRGPGARVHPRAASPESCERGKEGAFSTTQIGCFGTASG